MATGYHYPQDETSRRLVATNKCSCTPLTNPLPGYFTQYVKDYSEVCCLGMKTANGQVLKVSHIHPRPHSTQTITHK